ncbi:hypothetical protein FYJ45_15745 [Eisenbergiella tayi]|uniref:Uncharacterized protein n=1 Tax=Eisenbergiella porci TaxID=2652274 RepID=A0A6N7WIU8_9FIRM|nr:hypothetical protein [Eisenbergiella porci]MSS89685.1 hypothetical protein [Eisenbergiella porci]
MNKLRFSDNSEMEVIGVSCAGNILKINVPGTGLDNLVTDFKDSTKLSPLRYFEDDVLLRGYAGYTKFDGMDYTPDVLQEVDYTTEDVTTESGFREVRADIVTVTLEKVPAVAIVAARTEKNTADIDYLAMETGVEL